MSVRRVMNGRGTADAPVADARETNSAAAGNPLRKMKLQRLTPGRMRECVPKAVPSGDNPSC